MGTSLINSKLDDVDGSESAALTMKTYIPQSAAVLQGNINYTCPRIPCTDMTKARNCAPRGGLFPVSHKAYDNISRTWVPSALQAID